MIIKRALSVIIAFVLVLPTVSGLWLLRAIAATDIADEHLSSELVISANLNQEYLPSVAYNWKHHEYLVVWHNTWTIGTRDIRAVRVTETGQVLTEFLVYEHPTKDSAQPSVDYDPVNDRYLVVWIFDTFGDGSDLDIYGRFIPWEGPDAGITEFPIINWSTSQWNPQLVYARAMEEYLVVWTNTYTTGTPPAYISAKRIFADGSGFPSGANNSDLTISHASENRINPDVTYNLSRNEYLVVWQAVTSSNDIWGDRLTGSMVPLGGGEFSIAGWPDSEEKPAVAACKEADQYLVTWQSDVGTGGSDYAIYGWLVNGDGSLVGGPIQIDNTTGREEEIDVDCTRDGKQYLVAYQQEYTSSTFGITARLVASDQSMQPAFVIVPPTATTNRTSPFIAGGSSNYLAVWEHQQDFGYQEIHGRLVIPNINFLPMMVK